MIRRNREIIKEELQVMFTFMKDIPENSLSDFLDRVDRFLEKYKVRARKLKLSQKEIKELITRQKCICPICGEKLFIGDITNNDHIVALAIGGEDIVENIQVTHESCNHEKGCKQLSLI